MAIDGVAPRAKMNQQRARRFKSAQDAEEERKKAVEKGLEIPKDPFDSNAITPGTLFMEKLTAHLKYFIHKKISTDSSWQNVEIILSGHEVPGEGEHKIMAHIRHAKAQPDYPSNLRHCLYGLDADLIMLGLSSHDPHFAILREEVLFTPEAKKPKELSQQNFYLLHISIVREYLELEFEGISEEISFPYDFERILDDFILLNFFVGNDFLPELPSLLINDGALPIVIKTYQEFLRSSDGYLTERGEINFPRLGQWLDQFTDFEHKLFEKQAVDLEWLNEELDLITREERFDAVESHHFTLTPLQKKLLGPISDFASRANSIPKPDPMEDDIPIYTIKEEEFKLEEEDISFLRAFCAKTYLRLIFNNGQAALILDVDGIPDNETEVERMERMDEVSRAIDFYTNVEVDEFEEEDYDEEEEEEYSDEEGNHHSRPKGKIYSQKFVDWKNDYYEQKFGFNLEENKDKITDICENYLEGLQWVLFYYYRGCPSWSWYFRYHYAPKISDIKLAINKKITFDLGTPYHPFEQLMAVLPSKSKNLVPPGLQPLMLDENSPIIDFYPKTFELDMNGKRASWEAVVKIPFVDQDRLLKAIHEREAYLTPEERKRNSFGTDLIFLFNPQVDSVYPSSLPGVFAEVEHDHTIEQIYNEPVLPESSYKYGLCDGAKLGVNSLAGFPSLKTLPFTFSFEKAEVKIFERPSRRESLILSIRNQYAESDSFAISKQFLGRTVYVGWPYLRQATVVAVSDDMLKYTLDHGKIAQEPHQHLNDWQNDSRNIEMVYKRQGVKVGKTSLLIHVLPLAGMKKLPSGASVRQFETDMSKEVKLPLQVIVESVQNEDERFIEKPSLPVEEEYPIGSKVVSLLSIAYGTPVTVVGHDNGKLNVDLIKLDKPESKFGHFVRQREMSGLNYQPAFRFANHLGISPYFCSRITTRYMVSVNGKNYDIGINLRSENRRLKALGYTRKTNAGWEYSTLAVNLIHEYLTSFSDVLIPLMNSNVKTIPDLSTILGVDSKTASGKIEKMRSWLSSHVTNNVEITLVPFETEGFGAGACHDLETEIIKRQSTPPSYKVFTLKHVPRQALFSPSSPSYVLSSQKFNLGDRVVSIIDYGKVPLYSRGTVVAIKSFVSHVTLDIVFDYEMDSGNRLNGNLTTKRGLTVESGAVLNLSNPQLAVSHSSQLKNPKSSGQYAVKKPSAPKPRSANGVVLKKVTPPVFNKKPASKSSDKPADAPKKTDQPKPKILTKNKAKSETSPSKPKKEDKKDAKEAKSGDSLDTMNNDLSKELLSILHNSKPSDNSVSINPVKSTKNQTANQKKVRSAVINQLTQQQPPQHPPIPPMMQQGPGMMMYPPPFPPNAFPPGPGGPMPYPFPPPNNGQYNMPPQPPFIPNFNGNPNFMMPGNNYYPPPPPGPMAQPPKNAGEGQGSKSQGKIPTQPKGSGNNESSRGNRNGKQRGGHRGGRGGRGGNKGKGGSEQKAKE